MSPATGCATLSPTMATLAEISFGRSRFDDRLQRLLDESGIDPDEFEDLAYFGLVPFFILAGASVTTHAEGHGDHLHFRSVEITVPDELLEAFFAVLPQLLDQAYGDAELEAD